ncbi:hypothetical protein GCM10020221_12000 [Streptomyces thioluteus]|uniref:Aminoglycoside phosphotransferase domain-containing protein n=1 Tax=Streptomyces thioluteus TaxID=66431 RepID=A0ABN3WJY8_STRTU
MIPELLNRHWGFDPVDVTALEGGMNSLTWSVRSDTARWVGKAVPAHAAEAFAYGLGLADRLERAGIAAGAPEPTLDGRWTAPLGERTFALLRWVEGEEPEEQAVVGRTLARAHLVLGTAEPGRLYLPEEHLDIRPWLRPMAEGVMRLLDAAALTWGPVHGDPSMDAFRLDPATGRCGVIDWGGAGVWPRAYDLAALVMYEGPARMRPLIDAYIAEGALAREEMERALGPLLDYRWAGQAVYFAGRIARGDVTGLWSPDANEEGLEAARRWFHPNG